MQNDVFASSDKAVPWINYSVHLESSLHMLSPHKGGGRVEVQTPVSESSEAGLESVCLRNAQVTPLQAGV